MEPKIIRQPNGKDLIHAQRGWVYHVYQQSGKALVGLSLGPGPDRYAAYSVHNSSIADLEEFKADLDRLGWKYKKVIKAGPDQDASYTHGWTVTGAGSSLIYLCDVCVMHLCWRLRGEDG